jgi:hypothetical protein
MQLQTIAPNVYFSGVLGTNPMQMMRTLSIALLTINVLASLPMAKADTGGTACDIICDPLPGGKDDVPERVCVKTCQHGEEVIKTTTKEAMKDGKWKAIKVLEKVATPVVGLLDCQLICGNPLEGGCRVVSNLFKAGYKFFWRKDAQGATADAVSAAAKTACIALLATPGGYPSCMACCAGTKYIGVN